MSRQKWLGKDSTGETLKELPTTERNGGHSSMAYAPKRSKGHKKIVSIVSNVEDGTPSIINKMTHMKGGETSAGWPQTSPSV